MLATDALSSADQKAPPSPRCPSQPKASLSWIDDVWSNARWERGQPPPKTLRAYEKKFQCLRGSGLRGAFRKAWRGSKREFYDHRKKMLWRQEVEPYYGCTVGGCDTWAIPAWSVNCESAGGAASANLYGNTQTYVPGMSKWQQSLAAYRLMEDYGGGYGAYEAVFLAWESGCAGYPG